jgi:eukaryotic-like serine/threonine-protein kinase
VPEVEVPEKIGRYVVVNHLASGGMADLFLCRQEGPMGFQKLVAVKRIRVDHGDDDEFTDMFLDEARIAALLTHANIAQIYDLGMDERSPYLAMEFVNGRNLSAVMRKLSAHGQGVPGEVAATILIGVTRGLSYAHAKKGMDGQPLRLVHRDVTPHNVLVNVDGEVKLVDFGIAKASNQMARTRHGVLKGKYAYMSPEQVYGKSLDGRSDTFAAGVLLYELLTGQRLFKRGNTIETLKAVVSHVPPDPCVAHPHLDRDLVSIVGRALFKDRDRRYRDAEDMAMALENWRNQSFGLFSPRMLSEWIEDLFRDEINSGEGTIVLDDIGPVLMPSAVGDSQSISVSVAGSIGVPEQTVMTMLSSVVEPVVGADAPAAFMERSDVELDALATMPHVRNAPAPTLDDLPMPAANKLEKPEDPTVISGPPQATLADLPVKIEPRLEPGGGFMISAIDHKAVLPGPLSAQAGQKLARRQQMRIIAAALGLVGLLWWIFAP